MGQTSFVTKLLATMALVLGACASTPSLPADSRAATLSVQGLVCSDCGKDLEERARKVAGVRSAAFDAKLVELHLELAPGSDAQAVIQAVISEPVDGKAITASLGAGKGAYAPFATPDPSWDVKQLSSKGEDVPDLGASLAQGKVTLVDFSADWCGPCHALDEHINTLLANNQKLAYRRIDIVDWDSQVAQHYLRTAKELPYVIVFDAKGAEVARLAGGNPDELDAAIQKAAHP